MTVLIAAGVLLEVATSGGISGKGILTESVVKRD